MSNNENPIHAPAPVGGRPREGDEPRVSRTVTIDPRTSRAIDLNLVRLRQIEPQAAPGRVMDRMAVHCAATGFDVICPDPAKKKKGRSQASTPAPAMPASSGKA